MPAAHARLTQIADLLDYHIAAYDREWRYTYVNAAAERMLGRPREALLGRSIWELFPEAVGNQYYRELHDVAATGQSVHSDHYYAPFDQWFENHIYPLPDGIVVLAREVTDERRQALALRRTQDALAAAQERLQLALDAAEMVAWDWEAASDRLTLSSAATLILGTDNGDLLQQAGAGPALHPCGRDRTPESWRIQLPFVRPDSGQTIWLEDRGRIKTDVEGRAVSACGVLMNITERVRLEARLQEHVDELAEANRVKDEFLATLSHELRTPLNVIRGRLHMLPLAAGEQDMTRHVAVIDRNSAVIERIVGDLLDVARTTRGQLQLDRDHVACAQIIHAAAMAAQPAADAKQIALTVDIGDALPALWADGARLQQVVWNLVNNAVKFTPPGGRVTVTARHEDPTLVIRVIDSGIGIDPAVLPRVFDAFWQAEAGTTRRFGGLGLGLAVARTLVELHGGRIEARSEGLDRGATFEIRLPVSPVSASGGPEPLALQR